jgi:LuxR family transcriptional regulator
MEHWVSTFLDSLERAKSPAQAFSAVAEAARQLGFEWCAYGHQHPLPFTRSDCFLISNYMELWRLRYAEADYLAVDPTVSRARMSMQPMVWDEQVHREAPQMWEEARAFGLRHGWAQSCFAPNGAVGLLSLSRSVEPLNRAELLEKEPQLCWLVGRTHAAMSAHLAKPATRDGKRLTRQEKAMLRWTADGKSASQTARIASLSPHTVEWHLKNAARKLGAGTRAAATARAAASGMLR